ncbi:hypothetical protein OB955_19940 [Halobacteria archaeon AArc-m2/3/4]|uniref:Uncharacterized protein n=1 Tax=Natronoglomus mannanivorans TaxID=2979990 RepID=A0ABT2QJ88_9EURY|nr:hypothetical protein [Halobacteria archaeon AArc-m2/3/4]
MFTTPHKSRYFDQAEKLLCRLTRVFPEARRVISLQSAPGDVERELIEVGERQDREIRYASHDTDNIEYYRESDLHVGYRKHGHLAHLRWRRPSVVLAEDSRAQGLNETLGTAGVPAFARLFEPQREQRLVALTQSRPVRAVSLTLGSFGLPDPVPSKGELVAQSNPDAVDEVIRFVKQQQANDWESYTQVRKVIDRTTSTVWNRIFEKQSRTSCRTGEARDAGATTHNLHSTEIQKRERGLYSPRQSNLMPVGMARSAVSIWQREFTFNTKFGLLTIFHLAVFANGCLINLSCEPG